MDYVPVNTGLAEEFEGKMERNLLYRSTDNFITLYNNNMINKNNSEIDAVAKEVTEVYKNISLMNRKFIIKSNEEVVSEEFEVLFPHISFISTLKRIAKDIMSENYPEDTLIVFTESDQNTVQVFDPSTGEATPYEGAEKIRNANKLISSNPFLSNNIDMEPYGEDGEGISFKVTDVQDLDTSFITRIGELLEEYVE